MISEFLAESEPGGKYLPFKEGPREGRSEILPSWVEVPGEGVSCVERNPKFLDRGPGVPPGRKNP